MLTRALALSIIWLLLSAIVTMARGTHLRRGTPAHSIAWLTVVIGCGDLWAVLTFGAPLEVAALSLLAWLFGLWWIRRLPHWNGLGQVTWTMSLLATVLYVTYSFAVTAFTPLHPLGFLLSWVLFSLEVFALALSLSFTYETLDVCTRLRWPRQFKPARPIEGYSPKVSLHVPAYNEPPEVVEATLRTLAKLDYPAFEVLLIDNNTPDEATWRPLEAVCRELGPNFKCLHLDRWPGYKSGALNFALTQTAPDADIVGVIDADYQVRPDYLSATVPYFTHPKVAFLQTPQDYREYQGNRFQEACYDAYKYFFDLSMPVRNEHNAIIFGGTMGLIRKSVLQEIGGWDEWCITEDAEASLRILKRGYRSIYLNQAYGHGIMPLNFEGLKKQRFRWCFGGIQILRKHWEALMPWARWVDPDNRLTLAQRYYYLMGGAQWFNELATLIFTVLLLLGGLASLLGLGIGVRPLVGAVAAVPLVFLALNLWRFLWALRYALKLRWVEAWRAMGTYFSLSWVVTLASIQGLIQPRGVFLRTPKTGSRSGLMRALRITQWETMVGLICLLVGLGLVVTQPSFVTLPVGALLLWQAYFYLEAPLYSLMSVRGEAVPARVTSRGDIQGLVVTENRAAQWALALAVVLLLGYGLLRFLPAPAANPSYARFQPAELQPQQLLGAPPLPTPTPVIGAAPTSATPTPTPSPTTSPALSPTAPQTPIPTRFLGLTLTARPPTEASPEPVGTPPAPTQSPGATGPAPTPAPNQPPPAGTRTPAATLPPASTAPQTPLPTQAPSQPPLPTQAPTQKPLPTQVPSQPPLPTQAPTQRPQPTQVPTQNPQPTAVPTQKPQPTAVPTQKPQPTAVPTHPH